jgi:response regulator NasT
MVMNATLRIVVVTPEPPAAGGTDAGTQHQVDRSRILRIALLENGFNLVASLPADAFLRERLCQLQPDMIVVDAESEVRDALEHVVMATRDERRPIVLFTNDGDSANARHAVSAGVTAYIVAGLSSERIRPILDIAMARFEQEQALRQQLTDTRNALDARTAELQDRKVIDRAKGLLMQRHGLGEQQAYERLRKSAMDKNLRLAEVAQRLLDAFELLD